jgi:hypothetical protein
MMSGPSIPSMGIRPGTDPEAIRMASPRDLLARFPDLQGLRVHEGGRSLDNLHFLGLQPGAHAARELRDDRVLADHDGAEVHLEALALHAERLGLLHGPDDAGGLQQGLGRDATPVEARAPEGVLLDQRHLGAHAGRADGGRVASHTAADDDDLLLPGGGLARGGRFRRRGGCRRSWGCGGHGRFARLEQQADDGAHGDGLLRRDQDLAQGAVLGRLDLVGHLLRFEDEEDIPLLDGIPLLLPPFHNQPLGHGQTELGHDDIHRHGRIPSLSRFPGGAGTPPVSGTSLGRCGLQRRVTGW